MALLWIVLGIAMGRAQAESLPENIEALPGLMKVNMGTLYAVKDYVQVRYSLDPIISFTGEVNEELSKIERIGRTISKDPLLSQEHKTMLRMPQKTLYHLRSGTPGTT